MKNYHDFFISPEGGAWDDNTELHPMIDFSSDTILHDYIMMTEALNHVDYWLIVFCGHGYVNANDDTVLCMKDGSKVTGAQIKNMGKISPPRTLIVDCCREKDELDIPLLLDESLFSDTDMKLNAQACKTLYNRILESLPSGTFYEAYSTSIGECTGDTDTVGGVYSYNLLKIADETKRLLMGGCLSGGDNLATLRQIHDAATPYVVQMRKDRQHLCRSDNTNRIPFVVIA